MFRALAEFVGSLLIVASNVSYCRQEL